MTPEPRNANHRACMLPEHHILTVTRLDQTGISVVSANHPGDFSLELYPPAAAEGSLVSFTRMLAQAMSEALATSEPLPELPDRVPDELGRPKFHVSILEDGVVEVVWVGSAGSVQTTSRPPEDFSRSECYHRAAYLPATVFFPIGAPHVYVRNPETGCLTLNPEALYLKLADFELPYTIVTPES